MLLLVVGFCNAETIDGGPRGMFHWNETEVGTNASARCFFGPANATVTRTCLSPNNLSPAMIEICRTEATAQFMELQNVRDLLVLHMSEITEYFYSR